MNLVVMGDGAWGSALGALLKENGFDFTFWKSGKIPSKSTIIGALPTQHIRESLSSIGSPKDIIYVNCAKGIEKDTHYLPFHIVSEVLGEVDYPTLIGPSFSEEVKEKMPTLVNIGYRSKDTADIVKKLFQTDYFRVKLTKSIRALEFSGAFKNVYAIACGIADGLGFKMNTRVKLIILAMYELNSLTEKLGYKIDESGLPATIGDLILTCNSEESRNFSFGKLLVNNSLVKSLKLVGPTVEGYFTSDAVPYLEKETGLSLPLARFVYEATHEKNFEIGKSFKKFVKET